MAITLKNAKRMSERKWTLMLADFPEIKTWSNGQPDESTYGKCGLCEKFSGGFEDDCTPCPLSLDYCANNGVLHPDSLFWQIVSRLRNGNKSPETKSLIEKMLKAIQDIDLDKLRKKLHRR